MKMNGNDGKLTSPQKESDGGCERQRLATRCQYPGHDIKFFFGPSWCQPTIELMGLNPVARSPELTTPSR
jgi:hypothetical protein